MKTLIAILFLTLVGTIAQAAPSSDPLKFADDHCYFADDSDLCRTSIKNDPRTQTMNHYSLAVRVCSKQNISFAAKRTTCFAEAAKEMHDSDFRKDVSECYNKMAFWSQDDANKTFEEKANCQSDVFAKKASRVGSSTSTASSGGGTRH